MDRLTERDEFGNADIIGVDSGDLQLNLEFDEFNRVTDALNRFAAYEDSGMTPDEVETLHTLTKSYPSILGAAYKLKDYEQAEAEGRLIVLPVKVGDTVYQTDGVNIYECTILEIMHHDIYDANIIMFDDEAIGESIYLTREAAEAALKEAQQG